MKAKFSSTYQLPPFFACSLCPVRRPPFFFHCVLRPPTCAFTGGYFFFLLFFSCVYTGVCAQTDSLQQNCLLLTKLLLITGSLDASGYTIKVTTGKVGLVVLVGNSGAAVDSTTNVERESAACAWVNCGYLLWDSHKGAFSIIYGRERGGEG